MDRKQARAFEGFVAESGDALLRMATLLTSDPDLAEDVYQETLHRLALRWSRVDSPRAFCRRVMHNIVIDQARARRRRPRETSAVHDSGDPRSADQASAAELRPALLAALGSLTVQQRTIVVLPLQASPSGASAGSPAVKLTAAQTTLYQLSAAAATAARPSGRYVSLAEKQDDYERTSVIDSVTGDIWTYQRGVGVPGELPVDRGGSPTEAAFDAMPTQPDALRALLLRQARQEQAQAAAEEQRMLKAHGKPGAFPAPNLKLTDDDLVFEQATGMLWNPLVGPDLRSALYKVLAQTPGVVVNPDATDDLGRHAVEISRYDSAAGVDDQTYENPATGAVLETAFTYSKGDEPKGTDLYTSVTSSDTFPGDPY